MLKPYAVVDTTLPDVVQDQTFLPAPGEVRYEIVLSDEQVELLSQGIVSEALARQAYQMLGWKREQQRVAARKRKRV